MDNQNNSTQSKPGFFSFLYRTRLTVNKDKTAILNLSVLFSVIALLCAPWLVVAGVIVALLLGYHFGIERNAAAFDKDLEHVVKDAADNVKHAVENVTGSGSKDDHDTDAKA